MHDDAIDDFKVWTEADFDAMSWHDCRVHSLAVRESDGFSGELILDIDYILEWPRQGEGANFRVAQAFLRFHDVTDLRVGLSYQHVGATLQPFSLSGVGRRATGEGQANWRLTVNWPEGEIVFKASGFTQTQIGPAHRQSQQFLAQTLRIDWTRADQG